MVRTTLQVDDDVLEAVRVLARQRRLSLGTVISDLVRQALLKPPGLQETPEQRSGLPLLPRRSSRGLVDLNLVNQLRDEEC